MANHHRPRQSGDLVRGGAAASKPPRSALCFLGAALVVAVVVACSSGADTSVTPPAGPPSIAITQLSLGHGETGQGGDSSRLACDYTVGVTLEVGFWTLHTPGLCDATPQCGPVRLSLLDGVDGKRLGKAQYAANTSVDLNLTKLLDISTLRAGSYAVLAELVNDAGDVFTITNGGNSAAQQAFMLRLPGDCAEALGAAGAPSNEGGAAGFGGVPDLGAGGQDTEGGSSGNGGA